MSASEMKKQKKKPKLDKEIKKKVYKVVLIPQIKLESWNYVLGGVALVVSTMANAALPKALGRLLDGRSGESSNIPLWVIVVSGGVASCLRTVTFKRMEYRIANRLRSIVFASIVSPLRPLEWFDYDYVGNKGNGEEKQVNSASDNIFETPVVYSPSTLQEILSNDVEHVSKMLTQSFTGILRNASSMSHSTYNMILISPSLTCLSLGLVPLMGCVALACHTLKKAASNQLLQMQEATLDYIQERLYNVTTVRLCKAADREAQKLSAKISEQQVISRKVSTLEGVFIGGLFVSASLALGSVFYVGGRSVHQGKVSSGSLTSFATYSFLLGMGTSGLFKSLGELNGTYLRSAHRIWQVLMSEKQEQEQQQEHELCLELDSNNCRFVNECDSSSDLFTVKLDKVSFAYRNSRDKLVLNECSLTLKPQSVLALVGTNGAGKSTLVNILADLYTPTSGTIVWTRASPQLQVAVMPQTPSLFNMSILDNVRYAVPDASIDDVWNVLNLVQATEFVKALPNELNYVVGKAGQRLSGGQRQRLMLARSLLSRPQVLILDEPTTALDNFGVDAVQDAIRACAQTRTSLLVVTHHEATLKLAHEVAVLANGRIVQQGKYEELLDQPDSALFELMPELKMSA